MLEAERALDPSNRPALALFTEFPSNPLLRSSNLPRLRALADKYDFLIVIDDTLGNFLNVEVLPYADIVVTSLTKVFSGDSNVMGGRYRHSNSYLHLNHILTILLHITSLVLNPMQKHYAALKVHLEQTYEDTYFDEDAIFMERNSRDFARRVRIIDSNAEAICDMLHAASQVAPSERVITEVFYPKWQTAELYTARRVRQGEDVFAGGYGGLFSLAFASHAAAHAFFDTLKCYKGPSLGTNFTLASPYTILAHYGELQWAASFGVPETLVRVSVGLEPSEKLLATFATALRAAEVAHSAAGGA